ncbi:hypothetical protein SETIT_8G050500v2 [Setaria italica]|uniref:Uncharacterized protein n=1 Tax=Setaria italica TaxID=4555 RepID=A0A368S4C2_SETIT|nr:hypothetical protein SETIT_8G050500v2 [Setaria italica]
MCQFDSELKKFPIRAPRRQRQRRLRRGRESQASRLHQQQRQLRSLWDRQRRIAADGAVDQEARKTAVAQVKAGKIARTSGRFVTLPCLASRWPSGFPDLNAEKVPPQASEGESARPPTRFAGAVLQNEPAVRRARRLGSCAAPEHGRPGPPAAHRLSRMKHGGRRPPASSMDGGLQGALPQPSSTWTLHL